MYGILANSLFTATRVASDEHTAHTRATARADLEMPRLSSVVKGDAR